MSSEVVRCLTCERVKELQAWYEETCKGADHDPELDFRVVNKKIAEVFIHHCEEEQSYGRA